MACICVLEWDGPGNWRMEGAPGCRTPSRNRVSRAFAHDRVSKEELIASTEFVIEEPSGRPA